ncbi:MAG: zf-HC2 domain-containing protein [Verrucomicrobia bacterium]|nr:zf-HC2 domain-containing protein [Verrucomicrobiota bacterium]
MRCHEVRNLFGPYLDSELDAKTSFEIEQHLESCVDCARVFKAERELDAHIFSVLRRGKKTEGVWRKLEGQIASPTLWGRIRRKRTSTQVGLGFSLAVLVALFAIFVWPNLRHLDLAVAIEKDHRAFVEGTMAPEFIGPVPDEIFRTLNDRLDAQAFATLPSTVAFQADGARLCHLSGVPVAWIMGRYQGIPVSLIVLKRSELAHFPVAKRRIESGEPVICTRTGSFQFAARVVGEQVVCAVAETSKSQLEDLVKSVRGPG